MGLTEIQAMVLDKSIKKLVACFLEPGGEGFELKRRIENAVLSKGAPLATEGSKALWIRHLPQRVGVSNFTYLFKAGEEISTEHMDVATTAAVIREHTTFHDATMALKQALRSGERFLRRKVPQWEARSETRVKLALGFHDFRVEFRDRYGDANLKIEWQSRTVTRRLC